MTADAGPSAPSASPATAPVVRVVHGFAAKLIQFGLAHIQIPLSILRSVAPILTFKTTAVVTRYDDVVEVFTADDAFAVPYARKLDVIMGGLTFFLGMGDTDEYRRDTAAMREVVRVADIATRLVPATAAAAERIVAAANGRIEVVGDLIRAVTFEVLLDYFGTPAPTDGNLEVWATRLFEFQFADSGDDPALRTEVDVYAPALRAHVQGLIETRRAGGDTKDDVLGRCLALQAQGRPEFTDDKIRCALVGFIVGGLPQPPMVGPQALDQLLRRPKSLAGAQAVARRGDDDALRAYVLEGMRFDPLAPFLMRATIKEHRLADGTPRAKTITPGTNVMVSFASAMMDERRVQDPRTFDPNRPANEYIHFGHGLHECFGIHIVKALLPLMLKPLLARYSLDRAPGAAGQLRKQGAFADHMEVCFR